ncbi:unnamed protein product [Microthlaspi erraticum]|uniref:SWIM-type domain-containing protein n=1 Tax=Microthlaspi erraticum TaxID=1685480 RepID=A0A6D2JYB8_9BRAS|nr:unnamed protein product [Microthlaspi erraticum]
MQVMPLSLFVCESLVYLRLHRVWLGKLETVSLPCVKVMTLERNFYADEASLELLISSCPLLEDLFIIRTGMDHVKVLRVKSQTLTRLLIRIDLDCGLLIEGFDNATGVVIDAPRLRGLELVDEISENKTISNSGSLVRFSTYHCFDLKNRVDNFFTAISGVIDMRISYEAYKRAKGFPIPYLLQFIREKLGVWFAKRREDALSLQTPYSKGVEYLLAIRTHHAETYTVEHIDGWTFNVIGGGGHYIVNLENRSCECGVFQIEKIPCSHAIAASTEANMHISQNVCMTYTKESLYATYARPIYPEPTEDAEEEEDICLPPEVAPTRGRKKKSRYLTWLELSRKRQPKPRKVHKVYSCSLCRVPGHTRPHCVSH